MTDNQEREKKNNEDKERYFEIINKYESCFSNTEKEYIEVSSSCELTPSSLTSSKLFGKPYIPIDLNDKFPEKKHYPTDRKGFYLQMLAQINLSELPHFQLLPSKGILQFWIRPDEDFGLTDNDFQKVIYYPEIDTNEDNLITDFSFLPVPGEYCLPLEWYVDTSNISKNEQDKMRDNFYRDVMNIGYPLSFQKKKMLPNLTNIDPKWIENNQDDYDFLLDSLFYNTYYQKVSTGAKIDGYPYFTQNEFRKKMEDILLFQVDSSIGAPLGFGGYGVAGYYISPTDLKNLIFKNCYYDWDCD